MSPALASDGRFFDGLAADNSPHGRIACQTVGIVQVVGLPKAPEIGLGELPDKTLATARPATEVRRYVPGNPGQSDRIAMKELGNVRQEAPPTELYEDPSCRLVTDFAGTQCSTCSCTAPYLDPPGS